MVISIYYFYKVSSRGLSQSKYIFKNSLLEIRKNNNQKIKFFI